MWEVFVYMRETYVHHAGEDDFTLQEEATTSIQHNPKRNKKHKCKRKRDGVQRTLHVHDPDWEVIYVARKH